MKMKKLLFVCMFAAGLMLASCSMIGTPVGIAGLYTDVTSGVAVTSNNLGNKVGTSSASNILGIVAVGDAGINKAARSAGIKKISHVDQAQTNILGIVSTYKTVVYGE